MRGPRRNRYRVYNTKGKVSVVDRNIQEAQEAYPAFYYVQRFKAGIEDWDPMNGGLAKVAHLEDFALVKKGSKKVYIPVK